LAFWTSWGLGRGHVLGLLTAHITFKKDERIDCEVSEWAARRHTKFDNENQHLKQEARFKIRMCLQRYATSSHNNV
jgi:hypothetical protein